MQKLGHKPIMGVGTVDDMPISLGQFDLHEVRDGTFALDGGAVFGVVPRPLWEKHLEPDEKNRVRLALRCLLIVGDDRRILVDTGIGELWSPKYREIYAIDRGTCNVDTELERAGFRRADITDVVLTHLHFDHAGGAIRPKDGGAQIAFPRATFHLQRRNWKWAHQPSDKDSGSFRSDSFIWLEKSGQLHLLEGQAELYPGIHLVVSEGHTVGLQLVRIESGDETLFFCGDLIPTTAHLRSSWNMAYDLYPLTVIEEKKMILAQAVEERWILYFEHDPKIAACTVKEEQGQVTVDRIVPF